MFSTFDIPLTWAELFKRTLRETSADKCLGLAAQLAYYFLLALVPTFVCLVALVSFFPATQIQEAIVALGQFAPDDVLRIMREQLVALQGGQHGGIFTFGLVMALWSSSAAMVSITDTLNRVYDIEEGRPWWKVRLTAITLTVALALFVVLALGLVMIGPTLVDQLVAGWGFDPGVAAAAKILQWPVAFLMIAFAIGCIYYFAPDADQDWEWITPGAVLATVLWLLTSLAFKYYIANFADYNETYGSLGGAIILMLWFYLTGLAILIGAEMNAEIEHASPHAKDPGEKAPGVKKKIGAAAARAYEQRKRQAQPTTARVSPAAYVVLGLGLVARLLKKPADGERGSPTDRRA